MAQAWQPELQKEQSSPSEIGRPSVPAHWLLFAGQRTCPQLDSQAGKPLQVMVKVNVEDTWLPAASENTTRIKRVALPRTN